MQSSDRCQAQTYAGDRCARRWVAAKRALGGHLHLCRQHANCVWPLVIWPACRQHANCVWPLVIWPGANEKSVRCPLCEVSDA